jgi:hypothetical protein
MLRKSAREDPTFGTRVFVTSTDRADTRRTLDSESEQQRCRHVAWAFGLHMTRRQVILWSRVVQRDKPIFSAERLEGIQATCRSWTGLPTASRREFLEVTRTGRAKRRKVR